MRRILLPLCVLLGTVLLLGLGTWQVQRLAWKEALIAKREAGLGMPAAALPSDFESSEEAEGFDFRHVSIEGVFRHELEQTYGAEARNSVFGIHVLTPLVRDNGPAVLIDRGWIPLANIDPLTRSKA